MAPETTFRDRLILRADDICAMAGATRPAAGAGEGLPVFVVLHRARAGEPDWTHVYRPDGKCPRTVHLERALQGDRLNELLRWAAERLDLESAEPQALAA